MRAYHLLRADMTAGSGHEPAWTVGEERTWKGRGKPSLCERGYHWSPSWYDALRYAPGPVACIVEVSDAVEQDGTKGVSYTRKLLAAHNVERELRLWACECAERALYRERAAGREPDPRSWQAIEIARRYANGQARPEELHAAHATYAAHAAAYAAAYTDEVAWQHKRLDALLDAVFAEAANG